MLKRATPLSLRAILATIVFGFVFEASALPLSPKWMKAAEPIKVSQPVTSGDIDGVGAGDGGGGTQDLPVPATLILFAAGVVGMTLVRRKKQF